MPGVASARLDVAGYLAPDQQNYLEDAERRLTNAGLGGEFTYRGALDREQKIDFLRGLDVFSVPTVYVEPKGLFLLEAMACGVPVVQPRHGAFPEMLAKTSGGILVEPGDAQSLAEGLYKLWKDPALRARARTERHSTACASTTASADRPIACSRYRYRAEVGMCSQRRRAALGKIVSRRRRARCRCLSDVSLSFAPGDAAAIMGPSGSGKSTLLYILGALEPPTTGTVTLGGVNAFSLSPRDLAAFRNKEIGFVFQDHCLLPQCSVHRERARAHAGRDQPMPAATRTHVFWSIRSGSSHRVTHLPGQLSGGEKQRVALARALVRRPRLLLCDEPTGNLDRASADSVASLLFELQRQQKAILIVVTHSADLAARFPHPLRSRRSETAACGLISDEGQHSPPSKPALITGARISPSSAVSPLRSPCWRAR